MLLNLVGGAKVRLPGVQPPDQNLLIPCSFCSKKGSPYLGKPFFCDKPLIFN
jgi:hypothetical protein